MYAKTSSVAVGTAAALLATTSANTIARVAAAVLFVVGGALVLRWVAIRRNRG
jgi:hypothetical protein